MTFHNFPSDSSQLCWIIVCFSFSSRLILLGSKRVKKSPQQNRNQNLNEAILNLVSQSFSNRLKRTGKMFCVNANKAFFFFSTRLCCSRREITSGFFSFSSHPTNTRPEPHCETRWRSPNVLVITFLSLEDVFRWSAIDTRIKSDDDEALVEFGKRWRSPPVTILISGGKENSARMCTFGKFHYDSRSDCRARRKADSRAWLCSAKAFSDFFFARALRPSRLEEIREEKHSSCFCFRL